MAQIKEKKITFYNAKLIEGEKYTILNKAYETAISYDAQGKRTSEHMEYFYEDNDFDECYAESMHGYSILYNDGLELAKVCNGIYIGHYKHETTSDNVRITNYDGEDYCYTRQYDGEMLIFEHNPDYTDVHEYGYDENQRIIWHKIAITNYSGSIGGFDDDPDDEDFFNEDGSFKPNANDCSQFIKTIDYIHEEYIYQDDKLYKRVCYKCDAPSLSDFLNGDYTINDNEIVDEEKYVETEVVVGDERVVTVKSYRAKDNALNSKTISTYNAASNCIKHKVHADFIADDTTVHIEDTEYKYW